MFVKHDPRNNGQQPDVQPEIDWKKITDLQKDSAAVDQAVREQQAGLIGNDPRSLLMRAQQIKEKL